VAIRNNILETWFGVILPLAFKGVLKMKTSQKVCFRKRRSLERRQEGVSHQFCMWDKDVFYSRVSFCLSYNKHLGNPDTIYGARESQQHFPVCLSVFVGRIMRTKYQGFSLVGPKLGLILAHAGACGQGWGCRAARFPCLPTARTEGTSANWRLGMVRSGCWPMSVCISAGLAFLYV